MILSSIPQHKEIANVCDVVKLLQLDVDTWVNTIKEYASFSEEEREKQGLICKKCAYEYFSLKKMHEKYTKIYEKII